MHSVRDLLSGNHDGESPPLEISKKSEYKHQIHRRQDIIMLYDNEINELIDNKRDTEKKLERIIEEYKANLKNTNELIELMKQKKEEHLKEFDSKQNSIVNTTTTTIDSLNVSMLSSDIILYILQYYELAVYQLFMKNCEKKRKCISEQTVLSHLLFGYFDENRTIYTIFSSVSLDNARSRVVNYVIRNRGIKCVNLVHDLSSLTIDLSPEKPLQTNLFDIDTQKYCSARHPHNLISISSSNQRMQFKLIKSAPISVLYALAQTVLPTYFKYRKFSLYNDQKLIQYSDTTRVQQLIDLKIIEINIFTRVIDFDIILHPEYSFDHIEKLSLTNTDDIVDEYTKQFVSNCPNLTSLTAKPMDEIDYSNFKNLKYINLHSEPVTSIQSILSNSPHLISLHCYISSTNIITFDLNPNITELEIQVDGAISEKLICSIFNSTSIRRLSIISSIDNAVPVTCSKLIASNSNITELNIADNGFWASCIDDVLKNQTIKHLSIANKRNIPKSKVVDAITKSLVLNGHHFIEQLVGLKLSLFNDEIAKLLVQSAKSLNTLCIYDTKVSLDSMRMICISIPNLTHLTIVHCHLTEAIVPFVFLNTNLTYLNLSDNHLSLNNTSIFHMNSTLNTLILSGNAIETKTVVQLLQMKSLTYLDISDFVEDGGSRLPNKIMEAISQNKNLYTLKLGQLGVSENAFKNIKQVGEHIPIFIVSASGSNWYDDETDSNYDSDSDDSDSEYYCSDY
jgi:hypothetical protein